MEGGLLYVFLLRMTNQLPCMRLYHVREFLATMRDESNSIKNNQAWELVDPLFLGKSIRKKQVSKTKQKTNWSMISIRPVL